MSTYHFDQFCFTAHERILRRRDPTGGVVSIPLGGRALDVLLVLLRHNQRVVSKREIMGAVWSDFTPTDNNLAVHISLLRRALDEGRQGSSLIRTVSGRGYSLAAEVRAATADGAPDIVAAGDTGAPPASHVRPTGPVIAVLPFTNMSSDPEHDDLADGLMDDLITEISRRGWGLIVARNSIFTYKGRTGDVKQLGRELGTRYVLEGSVRKAGTRVRITAQLVDAATGSHLWADRFEGTLGNILDLPDRIATKVVLAIVPQLERSETERIRRKPTDSYDAYDCYVIGLASARQWTKEGLSEAQRLFYKAIELDPDFARPYGMAAICYSQRKASGWTTDPTAEIAETARLSGRAIALGRDDADALALGGFGYVYVIGGRSSSIPTSRWPIT